MEIDLLPDAAKALDALPVVMHERVRKVLTRLAGWPQVSGAKALSGNLAGSYRIRTGDYRVQFRVETARIVVERIGHRDGFYE